MQILNWTHFRAPTCVIFTSVRVHTLEVTDTDEEREGDGIITVEKSVVPAYKKGGF